MNKLRQKGLSLVELIIGIALASVIIAGVIQVFLANRQAFTMTESLVRIQENGRFALDFIGAAVRDAGNYGCVPEYSSQTGNIQAKTGDAALNGPEDFGAVVAAITSDGAAPAMGVVEFDAPDTLGLLTVTSNSSIIDNTVALGAGLIALEANPNASFNDDDWLFVSNCLVGDFIIADTNTTNNQIDITAALGEGFRQTQFTQLNQVSTVSEVNRLQFTVDTVNNALTVLENDSDPGNAQQLVDGIENIQFTYGVDTDGNFVPDYFDNIGEIVAAGDEEDIIAVKIFVLAVSNLEASNDVVTEEQTITLNDPSQTNQTVVMPDRQLRKVFESTVTLRNRMN